MFRRTNVPRQTWSATRRTELGLNLLNNVIERRDTNVTSYVKETL
jgi:hypothetical protein